MHPNKIKQVSKSLMNDVAAYRNLPLIRMVELFSKKKKYKQLREEHFPIYQAILKQHITKENAYILNAILMEMKNINSNKTTNEKATQKIANILDKKYKILEIVPEYKKNIKSNT